MIASTYRSEARGRVIRVRRAVVRLRRVLRGIRPRATTVAPATHGLAGVGEVGLGIAPPAVHYRAKDEGKEEEDCFRVS